MMFPLLLTSFVCLAIAIERWRLYKRAHCHLTLLKKALPSLIERQAFHDAQTLCHQAGGITGEILSETFTQHSLLANPLAYMEMQAQEAADRLRERLHYISAIVTLAPLMGLLGTVTGMIQSFKVLAVAEGQPLAVTGGVAEALIATAFGLLIAIFAMVTYLTLQQKLNAIVGEIETGTALLSACLPNANKDRP